MDTLPEAPPSWTLADLNVAWTASLSDNGRCPSQWGELLRENNVLRLKDTRGKYWRNRLASPSRFVYAFPSSAKYDWEQAFLKRLNRRLYTGKPLWVHLFSTPGSRNEYYGEWVVVDVRVEVRPGVSEMELARLRDQSPELRVAYGTGAVRYRSRNESAHASLLERLFPKEGWIVCHEPETLLDIHEPSVVHGVARTVTSMTRSYTCDFVVASRTGAKRLCIESKPCLEHVTDEALAKCRVLRDATLTRVVVVAGEGEDVRWLDVGPIGAQAGDECWHDEFSSLCEAVL